VTVAPGTTITVINQDQAPHTVTANDKSFDSRTISGAHVAKSLPPPSRVATPTSAPSTST
jgi:plastocyanin